MVTDPIADMLIQIKNASMASKREVVLPFSRMKHEVASILVKEGYLESASKTGKEPKTSLRLMLRYKDKMTVITDVRRRSKPGLRVYVNKDSIPRVLGGVGMAILSTPQGVMTDMEARKRGIGGELLCEIW